MRLGVGDVNHDFQRNPQRLIRLLGFEQSSAPAPRSWPEQALAQALDWALPWARVTPAPAPLRSQRVEDAFCAAVRTLEPTSLRPLLLLLGGFLDGRLGNAYSLVARWPQELAVDFFFREHPEGAAARRLVELYVRKGLPVILMGHSWGADAAVNAVARRLDVPIDLLVTLDPVSRKGPPAQLAHVRHWINVYVDYACASWRVPSYIVARLGGPWGPVLAAHENYRASPQVSHDDVGALISGPALRAIRRVLTA